MPGIQTETITLDSHGGRNHIASFQLSIVSKLKLITVKFVAQYSRQLESKLD